MASGLDSLAQTLQDGDLKLLRSHFAQYSDADFKRIRSKGIFFPTPIWTVLKSLSMVFPFTVKSGKTH